MFYGGCNNLNKFENYYAEKHEFKNLELTLARIDDALNKVKFTQSTLGEIIHIAGTNGKGSVTEMITNVLVKEGYIVGKYISIEKVIEKSKETYYEVLQKSSAGWHEGVNDYKPFVEYFLGVLLAAYREFSSRVMVLSASGMSKPERIREIIKNTLGKITKADLIRQCPDISQTTIQRTLMELQKKGEIIKLGGGRYTAYTWNREREV